MRKYSCILQLQMSKQNLYQWYPSEWLFLWLLETDLIMTSPSQSNSYSCLEVFTFNVFRNTWIYYQIDWSDKSCSVVGIFIDYEIQNFHFPMTCLIFLGKHKHILASCIIQQLREGIFNLNPSSWNTSTDVAYTVNSMAADNLTIHLRSKDIRIYCSDIIC